MFVRTVVRVGTNVAKVILEASRALRPNLLLMGWRGSPGQRSYLLGSTLDPVTRYAPCDIAVVRIGDLNGVHRALVPMSGGPNAPLALDLALSLAEDARVTVLYVIQESLGPMVEAAGYTIRAMVQHSLTVEETRAFYHVHEGKYFFEPLVAFMSSGPVVAIVLEGENVIEGLRSLVGATDPEEAGDGTIRRDFGENTRRNSVHASDSEESAKEEIAFWFSGRQLVR